MKGGGVGRGKAGGATGGQSWIPEPDPVNMEDYNFGHYYDMYSGNMSYDDWYYSFDPCTAAPAEPYYTEEKVSKFLRDWGPPVMIVFGVVGNTLSAAIMALVGQKRLSCCIYLSLLSLTEILVLLLRSGSDWVRSVLLVDITNWLLLQSNAMCEVYSFFTSFIYHMCSWLVVLPVAEMAVITRDFSRSHKICTTSRVKHTVLLTVFFVVFLNAHFFFTFSLLGPEWDPMCAKKQCTFMPGGWGMTFRDWLWPILGDNISALFGPILSVLLCLVYIIGKPCWSGSKPKSCVNTIMDNHFLMDTKALICFRRICIAMSVFFLWTALPEAAYNMYEFSLEKIGENEFSDPTSFAKRELAATLGSFLRDLFLSSKVLIYCACWDRFRQRIFRLISCLATRDYFRRQSDPSHRISVKREPSRSKLRKNSKAIRNSDIEKMDEERALTRVSSRNSFV